MDVINQSINSLYAFLLGISNPDTADDLLILIISIIILILTYIINAILSRLPIPLFMRSLVLLVFFIMAYLLTQSGNAASEFMFALTSVFFGTMVTIILLSDTAINRAWKRRLIILLILLGPPLLVAFGNLTSLDERLVLDLRAALVGSYMILIMTRLIKPSFTGV